MLEHSDHYILKCIDAGILTRDVLYKYPLRNANLAVVLKAYAITTHQPYTITKDYDFLSYYKLYLTKDGFEWLLHIFNEHSLEYLRSTFGVLFINAEPKDISKKTYVGYRNLRGIVGERPKAGTKQKAILVHKKGRVRKTYNFDTLREARDELFQLSRFYPVDDFELYRIRKLTRKGKVIHYKEKVRAVLPTNKRGANSNLPTIRR